MCGSLTDGKKKSGKAGVVENTNKSAKAITDEISNVVLGKEETIEMLMAGVLANGNVLFEDFPGLAKTLMSNTLADALGCEFKRIQFTPDLLPADITGSYFYDPEKNKFTFRKGPIFCNILLADEINRAPPKTQAALLEAMQEKQITIEGTTHKLSRPFIVLATQNPIEYEGTFPLPEAQLDRFLMRINLGYPSVEEELEIISEQEMAHPITVLESVTTPSGILEMQEAVNSIYVDSLIREYIVKLTESTRSHPEVYLGASPRASLGLFKTCLLYTSDAADE